MYKGVEEVSRHQQLAVHVKVLISRAGTGNVNGV